MAVAFKLSHVNVYIASLSISHIYPTVLPPSTRHATYRIAVLSRSDPTLFHHRHRRRRRPRHITRRKKLCRRNDLYRIKIHTPFDQLTTATRAPNAFGDAGYGRGSMVPISDLNNNIVIITTHATKNDNNNNNALLSLRFHE